MRGADRPLLFRRRLAQWRTDLPEWPFARLSKSLLVTMETIEKSQWRSRDETLLTFRGCDEVLSIGRLAATRLRVILGAQQPPGPDDGPPA